VPALGVLREHGRTGDEGENGERQGADVHADS
jgi:hypothetical protein